MSGEIKTVSTGKVANETSTLKEPAPALKEPAPVESKNLAAEGGSLVAEGESLVLAVGADGHWHYNRGGSPETIALEESLAHLYGCDRATLAPSGTCAIYLALRESLGRAQKSGGRVNLIYGSELYPGTPNVLKEFSKFSNMVQIDVCKRLEVIDLFKSNGVNGKSNVLFVESSSNPSGFMLDWAILPELRKMSKTLMVVVDNTWLSVASFNPFDVGADVVVASLTKYYSGGHAIAGAVLCRDATFIERVNRVKKSLGFHVSPHNASAILKNIPSLKERIATSSATTLVAVQKLNEEQKNLLVVHPCLPGHPSFEITSKYVKFGPSVFTFILDGTVETVGKLMSTSKLAEYKTSFGSTKNRFDSFPKRVKSKDKSKPPQTQCRFAVGFKTTPSDVIHAIEDLITRRNQNK